MKKLMSWFAISCLFLLVACSTKNNTVQTTITDQSNVSTTTTQETIFNLSQLKHTEHFNQHALEHIFYGTINRNKEATGYHYEGVSKIAKIIENTRSKDDKNGVYRAKISVENTPKQAMSSFFPKNWTTQQVVDAINIAYNNKRLISGNVYEGKYEHITIQMYLTDQQKIISAFPIYEK